MKILLCPLNWGLGHATRCIPVVRQLLAEGHEVVVVSDGHPLALLREEFPSLHFIEYASYRISYSSGKSQVGAMLRSFPALVLGMVGEHAWLKRLLEEEHFDRVISDNRFGMWSRHVHSVYITHQLMVKMPRRLKFLEPFVWRIHRFFIDKYDECWIPDGKEKKLSGDLAHKYPAPEHAKFVGPLSRFQGMESIPSNPEFECVAVISGVEPQRTIFEDRLISQYRTRSAKTLIVQGLPLAGKEEKQIGNVTLIPHLPDPELVAILLGARKIVCRSGYSTIMDLDALNCLHKAEFIPTPGQTEQEYLFTIHQSP